MNGEITEPLDLEVVAVEGIARDVISLVLRDPAGADLAPWTAGAHIEVELSNGLLRHYSLCGDVADRRHWTIAVLREEAGRGGSVHLHDTVRPGGRLRVRGLRNHFALAPSRRYVFIAGGIGITPLLPMMDEAERSGADWQLTYGGRRRASMAFADRLLERCPDRVRLLPEDEHGLLPVDEMLASPQADTLVYCCGPEPLIAAVEKACASWPAGALRVERFTAQPVDRTGDVEFEVELARSGTVVTVPPGRSILAVLADAGIEIDSACEEGICGTCETPLIGGTPDHRDSVLTDEERAANELIFPCISRAPGGRLVLGL